MHEQGDLAHITDTWLDIQMVERSGVELSQQCLPGFSAQQQAQTSCLKVGGSLRLLRFHCPGQAACSILTRS